jgi:pSer/pThr/pTyr-binding forkhead associated (FHA) protein
LSQARHVIGQAINATIKLQDAGVAAHHAELRQENGDVILVALEQNAETYVNGTPVQQRILSNGDRIQLGTVATLKYTTVPLTLTREQTGCVVDTLPAQGDTNAVGSSGTYRKPATT